MKKPIVTYCLSRIGNHHLLPITRCLSRIGNHHLLPITYYLISALILLSCTSEAYDTGDGDYSYLRADFVEIHTYEARQIDYAISDDGKRITPDRPFSVKWAEKGDTLYRALFYYNQKPDAGAKPLSLQSVYVLWPKDSADVKSQKYDPVTFESAWVSTCQRSDLTIKADQLSPVTHYLNIAFLVKTGQPDDEKARQSIGVISEQSDDGSLQLTLLHDQGVVPQYYSSRIYASIPLTASQLQQTVTLRINTYDGLLTRTFAAP